MSERPRWIAPAARAALALTAGAAAAFAHPPFGVLPGLLGYPVLMLLADRAPRPRGAFLAGWLAGFAYFLVGCWWVAEAFMVDPAQAWMAPFAASLLPAGLALFWGAAAWLFRRFAPPGVGKVLVFAALFCLFEWLRGHVLTGFPWNPAGAAWRAGSAGSQFASVVGVYGLSLVTVAAVCALGAPLDGGGRKARLGVFAAGAATLVALTAWGSWRLASAEPRATDVVVRVVQADVPQAVKWTPSAYQAILDRYLNLTAAPGASVPDIVIWPEGALPTTANEAFADDSIEGPALARALSPGQILLMGLSRGEPDPAAEGGARYYNSLFALRDEGEAAGLHILAVYDKHRLVPFGEYLPLGRLMGQLGVRSLVHVPADFSAGPTPAPLRLDGAPPVQPLICYESLFPGFTPGAGNRPDWIVNVSNDAWFGATSGPRQHLNLASYRAIETGLPIVRATPTGVSAVIDPWGRTAPDARLDPGESGVIDARLPAPAPITPFGRFGNIFFWLMILAGFAPVAKLWAIRSKIFTRP